MAHNTPKKISVATEHRNETLFGRSHWCSRWRLLLLGFYLGNALQTARTICSMYPADMVYAIPKASLLILGLDTLGVRIITHAGLAIDDALQGLTLPDRKKDLLPRSSVVVSLGACLIGRDPGCRTDTVRLRLHC